MSNQDKSTDVFKAWFAQTWQNDSLATDLIIFFSLFYYNLFYCKESGIRNYVRNKFCNIQLSELSIFFSADCFSEEEERAPSNWLILSLTMFMAELSTVRPWRPRTYFIDFHWHFHPTCFSVSPLPVRISFIRSGTASLTPPGIFCRFKQKSYKTNCLCSLKYTLGPFSPVFSSSMLDCL